MSNEIFNTGYVNPPTAPKPPKRSMPLKKIAIITSIAALIVIIFVVAFFMLKSNDDSKNDNNNIKSTAKTTVSETETTTAANATTETYCYVYTPTAEAATETTTVSTTTAITTYAANTTVAPSTVSPVTDKQDIDAAIRYYEQVTADLKIDEAISLCKPGSKEAVEVHLYNPRRFMTDEELELLRMETVIHSITDIATDGITATATLNSTTKVYEGAAEIQTADLVTLYHLEKIDGKWLITNTDEL